MNHLDIVIGIIILASILIIVTIKDYSTENFTVSDAQDIHNYEKLREMVLKYSDTFDDNLNLSNSNNSNNSNEILKNANINDYDKKNYTKYESKIDIGIGEPITNLQCSNSSIQKKYMTGNEKLKPFEISCPYEKGINNYTYFNKFYNAPIIPMEDYSVRGSNYYEYSSMSNPYKNTRILSHNTKGLPLSEMKYKNVPTGYNYAFQNTPAMKI